ncbi:MULTISPECIES: DUF5594 family protein [Caballeronia]|uniref:DUF5594 domain-containing protein n=1 Tax=Caballeronia zhejiangensis TaxID=871203 RepID=A0A656Q8S6_9BURK|nr:MULTISPECIES: DUF5594 family protein [Caballeronia]EKS67921.1 hypothetical protein BURK_022855 [Burkholderia sp. SJ98]KDR24888.1 hypothetical protein BG60_33395 [Caballeronia zhejiangensis]MCG7401368.1 DUF5594 family protein [Caballeronia zhejiangensis]MCI1043091.1 DUF5594 family protein [Caballeronia zhejiangensis]MDR5765067.1 DUF5594 family protein [Caballeronia sp. LZ028]
MNRQQALRFETEFMPRIVERVTRVVDHGVRVDILGYESPAVPTRLHVSAERAPRQGDEHRRVYPYPLNVFLTWDDDEIERLMGAGGEARFLRYLDAIGAKLDAWQGAREVDLATRSQAEPSVLFGGLDFEA